MERTRSSLNNLLSDFLYFTCYVKDAVNQLNIKFKV